MRPTAYQASLFLMLSLLFSHTMEAQNPGEKTTYLGEIFFSARGRG